MANFFQGLAEGLSGLPQEMIALRERHDRDRALAALGKTDWTKIGDPTAPAPRAGPSPAPTDAPSPELMKLATPLPGAQQPQRPMAGPSAAPAMQRPALPGGGPAPAPVAMPQAQPQQAPQPQRPQPDPTMSAAAQPGVQFDNPIAEANQTWGSIVNSIKQANPGIDPRTLMRAAEMQLDNIKGIAPTTKAIMSGQIKAQQLGFEMQYKSARLQQLNSKLEIDLRNAKTKEDQVRLMDDYHKNLIALGEDRVAATERGQDTRLEGQRETNANRIDVEKLRGSNRVELQGMRDTAAGQRAQAVLNGKRGPAMVAAIAKIRASGQEVTEDTINTLSTVFGGGGAGGQSAPAQAAPAPRAGGNGAPVKPPKYPNARLGRDPQGNPGWYIQQGGHTLKVG